MNWDEVGSRERPTAWDGALDRDCTTCGAKAETHCVIPGTTTKRKMPCVSRLPKRVTA